MFDSSGNAEWIVHRIKLLEILKGELLVDYPPVDLHLFGCHSIVAVLLLAKDASIRGTMIGA
jgi:hypothetical protein